MRGTISSYDNIGQTGTIKGDDGAAYLFSRHHVQSTIDIMAGQAVEFVPDGSTATGIIILTTTTEPPLSGFDGFLKRCSASINEITGAKGYDLKSAMLSFQGRMPRQHFWISYVLIMVASFVLSIIPLLGFILALALYWPSICIQIKRLHDMGYSGWLVTIPIAGSIVAGIAMVIGMLLLAGDSFGATSILSLIGGALILVGILLVLACGLGFLLWIGIKDSKPGPNAYGPNPKGL